MANAGSNQFLILTYADFSKAGSFRRRIVRSGGLELLMATHRRERFLFSWHSITLTEAGKSCGQVPGASKPVRVMLCQPCRKPIT